MITTSFVCKSCAINSDGCQSHGRACQVRFRPSKAMAEAMDAAHMLGLHGKLLKLHRSLGDDFNMFLTDLLTFFGVHLTEFIEDVLHTLMEKMIQVSN